jgi:hypothetical protein
MTASVHVNPAAYRARHAHELVETRLTCFGRTPCSQRCRQPGADPPAVSVPHHLIEPFAEPDDQRVEAFVREQQIGAETENEPVDSLAGRQLNRRCDVFGTRRKQDSGRAADAIGGVARQALRLPNLAPHALLQCGGERRPASRHPVHSADISRASACHSWSDRTSPARLRSAMMASQAADAADSVVV